MKYKKTLKLSFGLLILVRVREEAIWVSVFLYPEFSSIDIMRTHLQMKITCLKFHHHLASQSRQASHKLHILELSIILIFLYSTSVQMSTALKSCLIYHCFSYSPCPPTEVYSLCSSSVSSKQFLFFRYSTITLYCDSLFIYLTPQLHQMVNSENKDCILLIFMSSMPGIWYMLHA